MEDLSNHFSLLVRNPGTGKRPAQGQAGCRTPGCWPACFLSWAVTLVSADQGARSPLMTTAASVEAPGLVICHRRSLMLYYYYDSPKAQMMVSNF